MVIDLSEGAGNVNYKVDASTGLSDSDTVPYYVDVTTPQIDGNISGTSGTSGWFVSQILVSASASDSNSGVYSLEVNVTIPPTQTQPSVTESTASNSVPWTMRAT